MIGRTLDAVLSPLQIIAREFRREGQDSIWFDLADAMKSLVLPIRKCNYSITKQKDGTKEIEVYETWDGWGKYFSSEWEIKRECAKAFEKRRKAKVGESFDMKGAFHSKLELSYKGPCTVERVDKNTVAYRGYLISSNKEELVRNRREGWYDPVLYRGVIW